MNIVVVPYHDWKKCEREGFRTRDAHFMQEFGRHPDVDKVLVINRPISYSEMFFLNRNWRVKNAELCFKKKRIAISQVKNNFFTLDILSSEIFNPILMHRNWIPYVFSKSHVAEAVRFSLAYLDIKDYIMFMFQPFFSPLSKQLNPSLLVFDVLDNLLVLPSYKKMTGLRDYYQYCIEKADLISTNAPDNKTWLDKYRPDTQLILNGVDQRVFNPSSATLIPNDLKQIPKPIVGFAGKMQEMIDVQLIHKLSETFNDINFVFIGQKLNSKWVRSLWKLSNVHYLGDKHYRQLPDYLSYFDICIIPYSRENQHGVDPIKFYEYLAMEKPVVTSDIGGVGQFRDYPQVCVAKNHPGFIQGLDFFLKKIKRGESIRIKPLPEWCSWKYKAHKIIKSIEMKMEQPFRGSQYKRNVQD